MKSVHNKETPNFQDAIQEGTHTKKERDGEGAHERRKQERVVKEKPNEENVSRKRNNQICQ